MNNVPVLIFPDDFRQTCDKCKNSEFVSDINVHGCKIKRLIIRNYYQAEYCWYYDERKKDG